MKSLTVLFYLNYLLLNYMNHNAVASYKGTAKSCNFYRGYYFFTISTTL